MRNPRYVNNAGGILITQVDDIDLYLDGGSLYDDVINGKHGSVAPYIQPSSSEIANMELAQAKAEAKERLIKEKIESLLVDEFAEIDIENDINVIKSKKIKKK